MATPDDAKARAATTYNAAADHYDDDANSFWERFGRATIERLRPARGSRILDVCCGSGASALAAAEIVGPEGFVLGIDLAENLLERARAKAASRGLVNTEFRTGDILDLRLGDALFDGVVCVFGVFFVPDMPAAVTALWDAVRPGGRLALTTWGPRFFEPATTTFWNAVREVRPDLYKGFNPWDRICDAASLQALLEEAGIEQAKIVAERGAHPIPSPEAWWSAVLGSGYRGTLNQLAPAEQQHVYEANRAYILASGLSSVEANVVYAIANKGGRGEWPVADEVIRPFPASDWQQANEVLAELVLPLLGAPDRALDRARVKLALVKLAAGDLAALRRWAAEAATDWRDVLVAAGIANADWRTVLARDGFTVPKRSTDG